MRQALRKVLIAAILIGAPKAWAWGSPGHMAVACIAYQQLDPAIKTRVQALLKLNPNYKTWLAYIPAGTSKDDTALYLFMMAATWPDEIKMIPGYGADGPNHGDTPPADTSVSMRNIGYTDKSMHKYWHFVDTPLSPDNTAPATTPTPNVATQIVAFRTVLASNASSALKSYDLVWLLHLVGDIHQPLHAATRFIKGVSDGGGNDVPIDVAPQELHGYWDHLPGTGGTKSYLKAAKFATALPAADPAKVKDTNVSDWAKESFILAKSDAYKNPPINTDLRKSTLSADYRKTALDDARLRVALAGSRLAELLNKNLK